MKIKDIRFEWNTKYSIFCSERYLKSIANEYGWLGGFIENELFYVLPYIVKTKYIFRYLEFQTGIVDINNLYEVEKEKIFLEKSIDFLQNKSIDFIKPSITSAIFDVVPTTAIGAEFGSYFLDLTQSEEELWRNVHTKHRNVIRKAEKESVQILKGAQYLDISYEILAKTLRRSNISFYNYCEYKKIINSLEENVEIFVAEKNKQIQGCAVLPFSEYSAYYNWGGSIENPSLGAMNLLHWEAIKYFKEKGIKRYDFVGARISPEKGSKLEGIQRFKSRFGPTLKRGYLWKKNINPLKTNLYNFLVLIKTLNCKGDVVDQERK